MKEGEMKTLNGEEPLMGDNSVATINLGLKF
jgi:hypothetical protein